MYESSGYDFPNVESILKRFIKVMPKTKLIESELISVKMTGKNESSIHEICFHDNI